MASGVVIVVGAGGGGCSKDQQKGELREEGNRRGEI